MSSEVVLSGETILRVGTPGAFSYPDGTRVIDVAGRWIVPGFMDLHAHVPRDLVEQPQVLRKLLACGITGFRNPSETTDVTEIGWRAVSSWDRACGRPAV